VSKPENGKFSMVVEHFIRLL